MNALWMLVAALLFSLMGACIKLASRQYGIAELVFYRSLFGAATLYAYVQWRGLPLATPVAAMHLRRSVTGVAALALWFYATSLLPLGTAMTLNYTSPLFLAAFVVGIALRAKHEVDWKLAGTVVVGFVGVVFVLQPSFSQDEGGVALAGLASGVLSAAAYWSIRQLGLTGEPEWRTVFYFSLAGTVLGLAASLPSGFSAHDARGGWLLIAIGTTATLAQLAMTRAYARGHTLGTANLQYSAVIFATILGIAVFGDHIATSGWIGIAIIIASGIASTALTALKRPAQRAAETTDVEPTAEK